MGSKNWRALTREYMTQHAMGYRIILHSGITFKCTTDRVQSGEYTQSQGEVRGIMTVKKQGEKSPKFCKMNINSEKYRKVINSSTVV